MNKILIITISFLMTISCYEKHHKSVVEKKNYESDTLQKSNNEFYIVDSLGNKIPSIPEMEEEFKKFWKMFRNAIISNDFETVEANTIFPLETRGTLDSDPIVRIDKKKFQDVFKIFLKTYYSMSTNQIDYIKSQEIIKPYITNSYWQRIGDMQFKRIDGKWYLSFIYIEKKLIE